MKPTELKDIFIHKEDLELQETPISEVIVNSYKKTYTTEDDTNDGYDDQDRVLDLVDLMKRR